MYRKNVKGFGRTLPVYAECLHLLDDAEKSGTPPKFVTSAFLQEDNKKILQKCRIEARTNVLYSIVAEEVFSNLQKGQDAFDPHSVTPEQMVDAILQTVDGEMPTKQRSFLRKALLLFFPKREPVKQDDQ